MVIGLDIDGTITRHRESFAFLSQSATRAGHQIIVMTFRQERENTMADLAKWGLFAAAHVVVDHDEYELARLAR